MDSARARIFSRIKRSAAQVDEARRIAAVEARLNNPQRNIVPERGVGDEAHRIQVFTRLMTDVGGTVEVLDDANDVPAAVAAYLRNTNRPAQIRRGKDELLANLPWHRAQTLEVKEGRAADADTASLTHAFAGVAESGTIVQLSGPDNPTTLNFLPEAHIVFLEAKDLHASYEETWSRLRAIHGPGQMPRTVNMISGPSRTADIEQTIVRPAHGPKDMHVIIVRSK
ncbi:LutC/YkgG family protein [Taklimakanibacter lacteus]|uniref:LutC/YkgG family protein n=1 Tax=Taklimakanibacter lacteus TaxID=2268456 RepID=UPI000E6762A8